MVNGQPNNALHRTAAELDGYKLSLFATSATEYLVYNGAAVAAHLQALRAAVDMPDVREIPAVLEAATQAAASGDLAGAEVLLHEVVGLQEFSLGPLHSDLASTFNNLAVVCEMANKPADAEQFYRRAYAIASVSLSPDDPLVATSFNNLREFCQARGITTDLAADAGAESAVAAPPERPLAADATKRTTPKAAPAESALAVVPDGPTERARPEAAPSAPSPRTASSRAIIVGALAALTILAVLVAVWSSRETRGPDDSAELSAPVAVAPAPTVPSEAIPQAAAPAPPAPPVVDAPARPPVTLPAPARDASTRLLEAMVCQTLSTGGGEWKCVAPANPAAPGRLYFYTRVAAAEDVRVRHRWYRGDQLVQDVGLAVRANPGAGYRTFSRQTVNPLGAGEWRVEARTADGALLSEHRFAVR